MQSNNKMNCSKLVRNRNCKKLPMFKCMQTNEYFCTMHGKNLETFTFNDEHCKNEKERRRRIRRPTLVESQTHIDDDPEYVLFIAKKIEKELERSRILNSVYELNEHVDTGIKCCICLIDIPIDTQIVCDICKTPYHQPCVDLWIEINPSCPICRATE